MSTVIRSEVSKKNPYYIPKHRYLELKHFCLQYPDWVHERLEILARVPRENGEWSDPTGKTATRLKELDYYISLVDDACKDTDACLGEYVREAVIFNKGYTWLRTYMNIPCGKNLYYEMYRKFYWILSGLRS